jgi:hypothetical protein
VFFDDKIRYADLMLRWNIIQHFYPYYQEDHLDFVWENRLNEAFKMAGKITDNFEYYQTINWMMSAINDSDFISEKNDIFYINLISQITLGNIFPNYKWQKE